MMTSNVRQMFYMWHFVPGKVRNAGHNRKIRHRYSQEAAHNTETRGDRQLVYTLHGHEVATMTDTGSVYRLRLDNCGYPTRTTSAAMGEFVDLALPVSGLVVTATSVRMGHDTVEFTRDITIPITGKSEIMRTYTDVRVKGDKLYYKLWDREIVPHDLAGGYLLGSYQLLNRSGNTVPQLPMEAREVTKGYVEADYSVLHHIRRARSPSRREARLIAAVLRGEAVLHEW